MKIKVLAAAIICAGSSLCAPAVVVTPSVASVSDVTVFNVVDRLMAGSTRKARPASFAIQPGGFRGYTEQLLTFKNSLLDYSGSVASLGSFSSIRKPAFTTSAMTDDFNKFGEAALSEKQEKPPETGYSMMLLTGLAAMGAIALRRGSGQGA